MDQNIIILILILIAILVSFYSAYVSIDNSKKIRKLQNDIKDTLGNINSTLHLKKPDQKEVNQEKHNPELDQFPSLDEIENYDNKIKPLDESLKKELDNILDDKFSENNEDEEDNNEVAEDNNEDNNLESDELENNNNRQNTNILEKNLEIEEISNFNTTIDDELNNLLGNNTEEEKNNVNIEENILEDTDTEVKSNQSDELPELNNLNEELVRAMSDKNLKIICKREGIKVRGTKPERISRILDAIKYKININ